MKARLLINLFLLLNCCKSPEKSILEFDPRSLDENKITLSKIADDITYIPLDNSLQLDQIHPNFRFTKNSIWLCVTFTGILEFNRDGKFVRKIGNIGRGPGEYVYYSEFTVDDNKGTRLTLSIQVMADNVHLAPHGIEGFVVAMDKQNHYRTLYVIAIPSPFSSEARIMTVS